MWFLYQNQEIIIVTSLQSQLFVWFIYVIITQKKILKKFFIEIFQCSEWYNNKDYLTGSKRKQCKIMLLSFNKFSTAFSFYLNTI